MTECVLQTHMHTSVLVFFFFKLTAVLEVDVEFNGFLKYLRCIAEHPQGWECLMDQHLG